MEDIELKKMEYNHYRRELLFKTILQRDIKRLAKEYGRYLLDTKHQYWDEYLDDTTKQIIITKGELQARDIITLCRVADAQRIEGVISLPNTISQMLRIVENSLYVVEQIEQTLTNDRLWLYVIFPFKYISPIESDDFDRFVEYGHYTFSNPDPKEIQDKLTKLEEEILLKKAEMQHKKK